MKGGIIIFQHLAIEQSLYIVNEDFLDQFKQCSKIYALEDYLQSAVSVSKRDGHAIVFHIWCLLNEVKQNLIIHPEKMMHYSIDCFILQLLRRNKFIYFYNKDITDKTHQFILAYYLACATLQWGDTIILEHKEGQALCNLNNSREYFKVHASMDLSHPCNRDFHLFQKEIIFLMATDSRKTMRFHRNIKNAIQQTRDFVKMNFETIV